MRKKKSPRNVHLWTVQSCLFEIDKQEFFGSQTASFTHQQSIGLKVIFPTEEESAHYYDDFFNKVTPGVEGVSKTDWYIFRLAVDRFTQEIMAAAK